MNHVIGRWHLVIISVFLRTSSTHACKWSMLTNFCSHQSYTVTVDLDTVFLISFSNLLLLLDLEEKSVGILLYNSKVNKTVLIYFSLIRKPRNRHRPRLELPNSRGCFLFENMFKITWNLPQKISYIHFATSIKILMLKLKL